MEGLWLEGLERPGLRFLSSLGGCDVPTTTTTTTTTITGRNRLSSRASSEVGVRPLLLHRYYSYQVPHLSSLRRHHYYTATRRARLFRGEAARPRRGGRACYHSTATTTIRRTHLSRGGAARWACLLLLYRYRYYFH